MKIHQLKVELAILSLKGSPEGLSQIEAKKRLEEFGENSVQKLKKKSHLIEFVQSLTHFFALILWFAAALSFFAEWKEPGQGMATLGFAMIGVIFVNGAFSFWQEYKADRAVQLLQQMIPHRTKVLRDKKMTELDASLIVPGDVILLEEGDNVPADCRIIKGYSLRVNNATVTGESMSMSRDEKPSSEESLVQSRNTLLAGTSITSGECRALVFATGMHTEFGKIAHLTQAHGEGTSPLQREVAHLSRVIAVISTVTGTFFFFVGHKLGLPFWEALIFGIGVIAANVPEGLLPTVTLALAMGSQRMAKKSALIRHLPAVQTLGSATVICTDKTGTLTQNKMAVEKIYLADQFFDRASIRFHSDRFRSHAVFFECCYFCHTLKMADQNGASVLMGDPTEKALVEIAAEFSQYFKKSSRVDEIPFDSERKRLSVLQKTDSGFVLYTKGALESLLPYCDSFHGARSIQALTSADKSHLLEVQSRLASEGLRVIAIAYRNVPSFYKRDDLERELTLVGLVGLDDPPRPEVPSAVQKCKSAGIKVIMLTGDHPQTAQAIARRIGLFTSETSSILTGSELRKISDTQLRLVLSEKEILFARLEADQKMRIVSVLQQKKEIVAVTGDGVNDAPALKAADIGIAMGQTGTDIAKDAADMVLINDNFASIVDAIEEGRAIFENIRKFLTYILTHNVAELVPYLGYSLFAIPLPLTVIQILSIDLGTDTVPALGLGVEPPDPQVMTRPPIPITERLVTLPILLRTYCYLGLIEATAALSGFFFILNRGGWHYGDRLDNRDPLYLKATTACLIAIVIMQVANVFVCRSTSRSAFSFGWNPLIYYGIVTELVLIGLIGYTQIGNRIFGTYPLPLNAWLFVIPFALFMLAIEEARKWRSRRRSLN